MKKLFIISGLLFLFMQINCVKKDFKPTTTNTQDEQYMKMVNTTIAELRSWLPEDGSNYIIPATANWVVQGVVVSSDVNGNFYKAIHIQDSTAGIQLLIDGSGLYSYYPVGMRVFVKLAGLGLSTYNKQLQLGMFDNTSQKIINIPIKLSSDYIVKGSLNNAVDTLIATDVTTFSSIYQSRLVKLSNVMLDTTDPNKQTMGDIISQSSSYYINIIDARKNTLRLLTSQYATFANQSLPKGAGYIIGVLTQYGDYMQLSVNGMSDIHFNPDEGVILETEVPQNWQIKNISEVRSWYTGNPTRLPIASDTAIQGIVVSDNTYKNMQDTQIFIQQINDNNKALLILVPKAYASKLNFGDEVVINLNGGALVKNNAGLVVSFSKSDGGSGKSPTIILKSKENSVTPTVVTIDNLVNNFSDYESQLVQLNDMYAVFSNRGTSLKPSYSKNYSFLQDGNTNTSMAFRVLSAYTGTNVIPTTRFNIKAIAASYSSTPQLILRMPSDIEALGTAAPDPAPPPAGCDFYEDFEILSGTVGYSGSYVTTASGEWSIAGYGTMTSGSDRYDGAQSIRLRGSTSDATIGGNWIQMNFDKPNGVGTVKFKYGSYASHSGGQIFVEYSTNQGATWTRVSDFITSPAWSTVNAMQEAVIPVNVDGDIRIRIIKDVQSGSTSVNIDNICITDYAPLTERPVFSVPQGTYSTAQTVTITSATAGATIYYTLDGSTPTTASTVYSSPLTISSTTTLKAIAKSADMSESNITTAIYTINLGCDFFEDFESGTGANWYSGTDITFASGVWKVIGYGAMDGNDRYIGTKSIRFRGNNSDATTNGINGGNMVQMNFDKPNGVGIVKFKYASYSSHSGGQIFVEYSTDGGANWTRVSESVTAPAWSGNMLDAEIPVYVDGNVRIRIMKDRQTTSSSVNIDNICMTNYAPIANMPTINPAAGSYESPQNITINNNEAGSTIYYTTDGSTPTIGSMTYMGPFSLTATATTEIIVKAISVVSGKVSSLIASTTYTITPPGVIDDPVFSVAAGTYAGTQSVTITTATLGAAIYYTTDGTTPTSSSTAYSSAVSISKNTTLKAIAIKGAVNSNVVSADYKIRLTTPTFSPAAGTYTTAQTISMSATSGATIYYTLDGSTPTTSSSKYSTPLTISATTTIKSIAVMSDYENSNVATAAYTIDANPSITLMAWDFTEMASVATATPTTVNANIQTNDLIRGAGAAASSGSNSFRTDKFGNNGISIGNDDYFEFTVQATTGKVSLKAIKAIFAGTPTYYASPGVTSQFAYSLNGGSFTLIGESYQGTSLTPPNFDLSSVSALQNVPSGTVIKIRYYASGKTTTGGWGFNSPSSGTYGLTILGTIN